MTTQTKPQPNISILRTSATWRSARLAIFTALSVVGSFIPIPGPIPSLAFDSFPGFFLALYFGAAEGALVLGLGHLATAAIHGFPFGYLHIPVAVGMALAGIVMGLMNKLHKRWAFIPSAIAGIAINTALMVVVVPDFGWAFAITLVPGLLVAAIANVLVAVAAYLALRGKLKT
jgi:riboflavin transporter